MKERKILVTGGAGYVGSRVSAHLLLHGMNVVVLDKLLFGGEALLPLMGHARFNLIKGDIRDFKTIKAACKGVESIVHMAAVVGEEACQVDPNAAREINIEGTKLALEAASTEGVERLIFISTCSNYGISGSDTLVDEDAVLRPLSLYAETKVCAEGIVSKSAKKSFLTCILRLGTICGLSGRMRFNLLLNDIARKVARNEKITIFAPDAWRPFLHISDACQAILKCLNASPSLINDNIFNVVGENLKKQELIELIKIHFPKSEIEIVKKKNDPRSYRVSSGRIAKKIGFYTKHTVEEAFLEVVAAIKCGVFTDVNRAIYETLPEANSLRKKEKIIA